MALVLDHIAQHLELLAVPREDVAIVVPLGAVKDELCHCVCSKLLKERFAVAVHRPTGRHFQLGKSCFEALVTVPQRRVLKLTLGPADVDDGVWNDLGFGPLPDDYDARCAEIARRYAAYRQHLVDLEIATEQKRRAEACRATAARVQREREAKEAAARRDREAKAAAQHEREAKAAAVRHEREAKAAAQREREAMEREREPMERERIAKEAAVRREGYRVHKAKWDVVGSHNFYKRRFGAMYAFELPDVDGMTLEQLDALSAEVTKVGNACYRPWLERENAVRAAAAKARKSAESPPAGP